MEYKKLLGELQSDFSQFLSSGAEKVSAQDMLRLSQAMRNIIEYPSDSSRGNPSKRILMAVAAGLSSFATFGDTSDLTSTAVSLLSATAVAAATYLGAKKVQTRQIEQYDRDKGIEADIGIIRDVLSKALDIEPGSMRLSRGAVLEIVNKSYNLVEERYEQEQARVLSVVIPAILSDDLDMQKFKMLQRHVDGMKVVDELREAIVERRLNGETLLSDEQTLYEIAESRDLHRRVAVGLLADISGVKNADMIDDPTFWQRISDTLSAKLNRSQAAENAPAAFAPKL